MKYHITQFLSVLTKTAVRKDSIHLHNSNISHFISHHSLFKIKHSSLKPVSEVVVIKEASKCYAKPISKVHRNICRHVNQ